MILQEAITKIGYDDNWGIWACAPFTANSEARFGQVQFENGGLLDDKAFFADGMACGDFVGEYCDGEDIDELGDEAALEMIAEYEATREQFEATDES